MNPKRLMEILREKHGKDLDLKNDVYFLFLMDGFFCAYFDDDEETFKLEIEFLPEGHTFVYGTDESLERILGE